jgi:hypothetical protein
MNVENMLRRMEGGNISFTLLATFSAATERKGRGGQPVRERGLPRGMLLRHTNASFNPSSGVNPNNTPRECNTMTKPEDCTLPAIAVYALEQWLVARERRLLQMEAHRTLPIIAVYALEQRPCDVRVA